jgi:hypothetical protein
MDDPLDGLIGFCIAVVFLIAVPVIALNIAWELLKVMLQWLSVHWPLLVAIPIGLVLVTLPLLLILRGLVRWLRLLVIRRGFKQAELWLRDRTAQAQAEMEDACTRHQVANGEVVYPRRRDAV